MNIYYIYIHSKPDGEIFYVGKGKDNRAYQKTMRNRYWHFVYNKYGYIVNIIESGLSQEEACVKEKLLINSIGRKDLGKGTLVNMTDGGDGNNNFSIESRKAISDKAKGRISGKKGKPLSQ